MERERHKIVDSIHEMHSSCMQVELSKHNLDLMHPQEAWKAKEEQQKERKEELKEKEVQQKDIDHLFNEWECIQVNISNLNNETNEDLYQDIQSDIDALLCRTNFLQIC